jgi:hypothetical protein
MATYSYSVAKTVLTENEKDRLVCLSLNRRPDGSVSESVSQSRCKLYANIHRSTGRKLPPSSEVRR